MFRHPDSINSHQFPIPRARHLKSCSPWRRSALETPYTRWPGIPRGIRVDMADAKKHRKTQLFPIEHMGKHRFTTYTIKHVNIKSAIYRWLFHSYLHLKAISQPAMLITEEYCFGGVPTAPSWPSFHPENCRWSSNFSLAIKWIYQ